ncbi:hypothetical protein L7F22_037357 [Adiantum nelumboides]|nr:hypothetical protein [Adiantum nelumboides]
MRWCILRMAARWGIVIPGSFLSEIGTPRIQVGTARAECMQHYGERSSQEEKLRDKPGYEHLNEPLHVLIEAEQPANVIDIQLNQAREIIEDLLKPVDETHDYFKKQQLRELAMLNGTLREDSPSWSGNASPFSNSGMKRAKTRG